MYGAACANARRAKHERRACCAAGRQQQAPSVLARRDDGTWRRSPARPPASRRRSCWRRRGARRTSRHDHGDEGEHLGQQQRRVAQLGQRPQAVRRRVQPEWAALWQQRRGVKNLGVGRATKTAVAEGGGRSGTSRTERISTPHPDISRRCCCHRCHHHHRHHPRTPTPPTKPTTATPTSLRGACVTPRACSLMSRTSSASQDIARRTNCDHESSGVHGGGRGGEGGDMRRR